MTLPDTKTLRIGLLHPGEMGASVGAAAREAGATVAWASSGRSDQSRSRAAKAGLEDSRSLAELAASSELIISVCPPDAATALAENVAATGFTGIYVDANAVSTGTAHKVCAIIETSGARFVDGGIIGPPARSPGTTRLYLSGAEAPAVADVFQGSTLQAIAIDTRPGAASALKMCYAAWTKGSAALLTDVRALALAEGVEGALLEEWSLSQPGLDARSTAAARDNAFKAWRFAGEMREIAATFEASQLPGGFHRAAADIYERLSGYKDCDPAPALSELLETILGDRT
jgi:3-hydroxyisobutyrate dehydrogenase-like beta-hydroxyacid dehydrogenase